jgi:hypothetical protein
MLRPIVSSLFLAAAALAQQPESVLNVRLVIGLENIKHNTSGKLTVQNGAMQFDSATPAKVPAPSIDDIFVGTETTQGGGKTGRVAKTAAIAAPYESGAALSLLLRTKVDMLVVSYRDGEGGRHAAIFALPKGQAEAVKIKLVAAGAHVSAAVEPVLHTAQAASPTAAPQKISTLGQSMPAIMIEPVGAGDVVIPAEFRLAIYERLVERVVEMGKFQRVFRSGDKAAEAFPNLIRLHTTVENFKEGSEMKREITKVLGATKVDVTATVTGPDGKTLLNRRVQGKVRFFGENLGVTNDIAKRVTKALRESI